jgi:hypothetical protein
MWAERLRVDGSKWQLTAQNDMRGFMEGSAL